MAVAVATRRLGPQELFAGVWAVVWLIGVTLAVGVAGLAGPAGALRFVSLLSLAFGLWLFLRDGGRRITAVGVYALALAVFGGMAGLWRSYTVDGLGSFDVAAGLLILSTHVLTWVLFWNRGAAAVRPREPVAVDPRVTRWGIQVGTVLLVSGDALARLGAVVGPVPKSLSFVGVVLGSTAALASRSAGHRRRRTPRGLAISSSLFAGYIVLVFSGFGRLVVAALGLSIAIAAGRFLFRRSGKALILVSIVPALAIFGVIRSSDGTAKSGLGSVLVPIETFADVMERHERVGADLAGGSTFVAAAVAQVPSGLWASKPAGFGTVLTATFEPAQLASGHSMAALIHGEWWWNFGWAGTVLMVPALGLGLRWLDSHLAKAMHRSLTTRRALLMLVMTAVAAAGTLDLFWVGTFTYSARTVTSVLVVAALLVVFRSPAITAKPPQR